MSVVFDCDETTALIRAFDRTMILIGVDPLDEPEVATRVGRTLMKVFKTLATSLTIDELALATMEQIKLDNRPKPSLRLIP